MRTVPKWGKVIGILMIVFGSLGVFFQGYKIMIPGILKMQEKMMTDFDNLGNDDVDRRVAFENFKQVMDLSDLQSTVLLIGGILGLIICILYIIGGAKLLKMGSQNLKWGKTMLLVSLIMNVLLFAGLYADGGGIIVYAMSFYIGIGLVIDLVLMIILVSNNKDDYDLSKNSELEGYSITSNSDEVL